MPKRSSKPSSDPNRAAFDVVSKATGGMSPLERKIREVMKEYGQSGTLPVTPSMKLADPPSEKNPAAVELGRLGGLKGGKARAKKLSADERSEIAKVAAAARWGKK